MTGSEVYHIEPEAAFVTGRHRVYRESDSLLPAGKCGKVNSAFLSQLLRVDLIKPASMSVRSSVHKKFLRFERNLVCR